MDSEFFITLASDQCSKIYLGNSSSEFRNQLLDPIIPTGEIFEVGLSEIIFQETNKIIKPTTPATTTATTTEAKTFFTKGASDNSITVIKTEEQIYKVKKEDEGLTNWFQSIVTFWKGHETSEVRLEFSKTYSILGYPPSTIMKFVDKEKDFVLMLNGEWSEVLGFKQTIFQGGETYTSENAISEESFTKIPLGTPMPFRFIKRTTTLLAIEEPSNYDRDELIENMFDAFNEEKIKVRLVELEPGILKVYIDDPSIIFSFPRVVNKILGVEDNYYFRKPLTEVILSDWDTPSSKAKKPKLEVEERSVDKNTRLVFVLCDIVNPSFYAKECISMLRLIPSGQSTINKERHIIFETVNYIRVLGEQVQEIKIQLVNENLNLIGDSSTPTVVVLHFRRRS